MNMTRRQILALAAALPLGFPPRSAQAAGQAPAARVGKKGLGLSEKMRSAEKNHRFLQAVEAHWLYNWNVQRPQPLPPRIAYSPMIYRPGRDMARHLDRIKQGAAEHGFTELLGYNEPDAKSQGNTSVEAALDAWPLGNE
jgi:hypothetical protein